MTDNAALLQSIQSINEMVASVNNSCDHDCLMAKQRSELKQRYLDAERNVRVAPEKLTQAEHDYLLNRDGPKKYTELLRTRYGKNADEEIQKLKDEHNMIMNEIDLGIMKIKSQRDELYNSTNYKNMLSSMQTRIENETEDKERSTAVSNRKIFYMEKQIESFSWWYYLFRNLYWICAMVWIAVGVIYYRQFTTRSLLIFVFIVAYPFFMIWLFVAAYSLVKYVASLFPRDVYLSI
jgi:small-conductance mechanosensitive channel